MSGKAILENKKTKKFLALKIISAVIFSVVTALLVWWFLEVLSTPLVSESTNGVTINERSLALAFFIVIGLIIVGGIGYSINLVLSITGIILSSINYKKRTTAKGSLIFFIIFTILPVLTEILFFLLTLFV